MKNLKLELTSMQAFSTAHFTIWPDIKRAGTLNEFCMFEAVGMEHADENLFSRLIIPVLCVDSPIYLVQAPTPHISQTAQQFQQFCSHTAREQMPDFIPSALLPQEEFPAYKAFTNQENGNIFLNALSDLASHATELTKNKNRIFAFPLVIAPELKLASADEKLSTINYGLLMSRRHSVVGHAAIRFSTSKGLAPFISRMLEIRKSLSSQVKKGEA